jgi:two-component system nitrate/nitrite response regulator NarL
MFRANSYNRYIRFVCFLETHLMCPLFAATSEATGVLIADSNRMQAQLLAGALRRRPEFHVATCEMDVASILEAVTAEVPRVVLISLTAPSGSADTLMTLRRFHLAYPEIAKVLLVDSCGRELVVSAFRSGARGIFSLTQSDLRSLCRCLVRVASGQIWANTEQWNILLEQIAEIPSLRIRNAEGSPILTPREEQVAALVAEGLGNRPIARELNLSEHTVKKYLFRIFEKLGVSNRVELVLYVVNHGDPRQAEWVAGVPRTVLPT